MLYKNEALNRVSDHAGADPKELKERIRKKLTIDYWVEYARKVMAIVVALSVLISAGFAIRYAWNFRHVEDRYVDKESLFSMLQKPKNKGEEVKVEYFIGGSKAAETFLKDGLRHQNSESFYESGHQFRSALYYYDTLVREVYFYKNGDTIKNFPVIHDDKEVYHITVPATKTHASFEMDFYDGKMITASFTEHTN